MEAIIKAFGIDWHLIVIQIFNFAILAGALWYFLYTPVLKMLSLREATLKKGVEDADAAAQMLQNADGERQQILIKAQGEASDIVTRASVHAEEKVAEIMEEAQERALRTAEDAKHKAEEIKAHAFRESEAEIARTAILVAEKILNEKLAK